MASYAPRRHLREVALVPEEAALLFVDIQNYNCHRDGALYPNTEDPSHDLAYWWQTLQETMPRWQLLQQWARDTHVEVMYTVIQSLTRDGRDRGLDYKISGFNVPPGCWDAQVVNELRPGPDEMVLAKSSSSVFGSTTINYLLRNTGKRFLVIAGCVTDQCVDHAVRDAADLGYLVTLVTDCCCTYSAERHEASLRAIAGYGRQRTLQQLLEEQRYPRQGTREGTPSSLQHTP